MRVERALVGLFCISAMTLAGCGGQLAYNIPPSSRLMEPGPGVGGPGPGVIPPAGNMYGIYGGAVGRFGDGPGGYIGGGYGGYEYGGDCANNARGPMNQNAPVMAGGNGGTNSGVVQAGYCGCGSPVGCGDACGGSCGMDGCDCGGGCIGDCYGGDCCGGGCCSCGGAGCPLCNGGALGALHGLFQGHGCGYGHGREAYADGGAMVGPATSQVAFLGAEGVQISWDVGGAGFFDSVPLVIPGRQDFYQGAIYRLKVTNIPGRPGVELYPTLEIAPVTPRTDAYLAHAPIPVQFTEEDFDQVLSGNFVTKVIYLPDPEFQELALAGVETLVSTRLDPGVDPIAEADRRGSILAILRMGNKDLEPGGVESFEPEQVQPLNYVTQTSYNEGPTDSDRSYASHALYEEQTNSSGQPASSGVVPAQCYDGGGYYDGGGCYDGGGDCYGGGGGFYGGGMGGPMPMGMPTSGFAPPAIPPNYVAGAPQWGMPITGTPIGLPGPPHVPLGVPAGLRKHVMKNRTRVLMPPPVAKVHISVKQRPGLNYPRPVNHVAIDETQREPLRLIPSWFPGFFHHARAAGNVGYGGGGGAYGGVYGPADCQ